MADEQYRQSSLHGQSRRSQTLGQHDPRTRRGSQGFSGVGAEDHYIGPGIFKNQYGELTLDFEAVDKFIKTGEIPPGGKNPGDPRDPIDPTDPGGFGQDPIGPSDPDPPDPTGTLQRDKKEPDPPDPEPPILQRDKGRRPRFESDVVISGRDESRPLAPVDLTSRRTAFKWQKSGTAFHERNLSRDAVLNTERVYRNFTPPTEYSLTDLQPIEPTRVITGDAKVGAGRLALVDPTAGALTITIPRATQYPNQVVGIKNVTSLATSIAINVEGAGLIDDSASTSIQSAYGLLWLVSDGKQWRGPGNHVMAHGSGSASNPAFSFLNSRDTGMYYAFGFGDTLLFAVNAVNVLTMIEAAGATFATFSGNVDVQTLSFNNTTFSPWFTVTKTADETKQSDTTLAADSALVFAMAANTDYIFRLVIFYTAQTPADFKFDFNGPAGVTEFRAVSAIVDPDGGNLSVLDTALNNARSVLAASGTHGSIVIEGKIENGANAGNLEFRWAQNTSSIGTTVVLEGSRLEYQEQ